MAITRDDLHSHQVVTTEMLMVMAKTADAMKLNRRLVTEKLADDLDPNGLHIVVPMLLHNETEMRVKVLMKMKDTMDPTEAWLDIPLDKPSGKSAYANWSDVKRHSDSVIEELVKESVADEEV